MIGAIALVFAVTVRYFPWPGGVVAHALSLLGWLLSVYAFGMGCFMLYGSLVGKVRARQELLGLVPWSGDEAVLDVGCGRSLLLTAAARRVPFGHAVGIDLWLARDQSGNRPEATLANARLEGVAERVTVLTGDARTLPFEDHTFDVVVSHWVVHNLSTRMDRALALDEMARVLRPGGWLLLADIEHHADYVSRLGELGFVGIRHVMSPFWDQVRRIVTFATFRPGTVIAQAPA